MSANRFRFNEEVLPDFRLAHNQQWDEATSDSKDTTTDNILDVRLRKLLQMIEENPLSTIREWAIVLNLSNSHLQRLFKQATGMGLGRALTEKRLSIAAQLLADTNMSVKEVAHAVGYEHTSSFTRAFERHFEEGPRHYRQRNAA